MRKITKSEVKVGLAIDLCAGVFNSSTALSLFLEKNGVDLNAPLKEGKPWTVSNLLEAMTKSAEQLREMVKEELLASTMENNK